jgi:hypothetical protein
MAGARAADGRVRPFGLCAVRYTTVRVCIRIRTVRVCIGVCTVRVCTRIRTIRICAIHIRSLHN